jgi:hypothetical protein
MSTESHRAAMSAPIPRDPCPYCESADEKHGAATCPGCFERNFERSEIYTDNSVLARGARLWDSIWGAVIGGRSV